jgi:ADP-heptose:LPS heptosyltransferase
VIRDIINYNELNLLKEFPLLFKLRLKKIFGQKTENDGGVLVINTSIIGDFVASLPALRHFINEQGQEIDMVVIQPVKSLAESIKGVNRVFTAKSIYQRSYEKAVPLEEIPTNYSYVKIFRISPDAYNILNFIKYSKIDLYDIPFIKYCGHIIKNTQLKREIKQWSDVNFEIIGAKRTNKIIFFNDIFKFTDSDYAAVRAIPEMREDGKKIIIHTGSGWQIKLWDNDKWAELIRKINEEGNFTFIIIGKTGLEEESFENIQKNLNFKIHSLINKVDLKTTLLIMRISDYFIGIDSGPRNLAHLADLRSISMLGPAPKNFMPLSEKDIVIDKFTCRCKSFYYLHKESAMQRITVDEVFAGFKSLFAQ